MHNQIKISFRRLSGLQFYNHFDLQMNVCLKQINDEDAPGNVVQSTLCVVKQLSLKLLMFKDTYKALINLT